MDLDFEIALYRGIIRSRPIGVHKHFHIISIANYMSQQLGETVSIQRIWQSLSTLYDLEALDNQVNSLLSLISCIELFKLKD